MKSLKKKNVTKNWAMISSAVNLEEFLPQQVRKAYLEGAQEGLINTHHAPRVVKLPAVVWGGEKGHQLSFGEKLVAILHNLKKSSHFATKLDVDPQRTTMHPRCRPRGETYLNIDFSSSAQVKFNFELFWKKKKIKFLVPML